MNLKQNKKRYMGVFGGKTKEGENDVNVIISKTNQETKTSLKP